MLKLIEEAVDKINLDCKGSTMTYHFKFTDFKYESDYYTTLRLSIEAVSNKNEYAKVTLLQNWVDVPLLRSVLQGDYEIDLAKKDLVKEFVTNVFRVLLVGINSPLIIKETEEKLIESEKQWDSIKKQIVEK